ncbi:hypothetical protein I656_01837 [Geobacillus sp. WSUCF1]|nr:hypothetical protein I656_01837 [Geobacillus sp. WSUCF1]
MCTALERSGVGKETSVVLAGVFLFSSMIIFSFWSPCKSIVDSVCSGLEGRNEKIKGKLSNPLDNRSVDAYLKWRKGNAK